MTTALVPRTMLVQTVADATSLGEIVFKSKLFPDTASAAQAVIKILAGTEMGFGPLASLADVHIIEGKPSLGSHLRAAAIKRSEKYDYAILEHSDEVCSLEFFERTGASGVTRKSCPGWESKGVICYTLTSAKEKNWHLTRAGKAKNTWIKTPRNMLFARVLSDGYRFYCPDLTAGVLSYDPDELEASQSTVSPQPPAPETPRVQSTPPSVEDAEVASASQVAIPDLDKLVSQNQLDVIQAHLLRLNTSPAGLKARLIERFQVDDVTKLTRRQANQLIEGLIAKEKK